MAGLINIVGTDDNPGGELELGVLGWFTLSDGAPDAVAEVTIGTTPSETGSSIDTGTEFGIGPDPDPDPEAEVVDRSLLIVPEQSSGIGILPPDNPVMMRLFDLLRENSTAAAFEFVEAEDQAIGEQPVASVAAQASVSSEAALPEQAVNPAFAPIAKEPEGIRAFASSVSQPSLPNPLFSEGVSGSTAAIAADEGPAARQQSQALLAQEFDIPSISGTTGAQTECTGIEIAKRVQLIRQDMAAFGANGRAELFANRAEESRSVEFFA